MGEWSRVRLGEVFDVQLGKMLGAGSQNGQQFPYLANRNVQWGRVVIDELGTMNFTAGECERYRLERGDLLVCEGGEVGRAALWSDELPECYFQNAIHRLRASAAVDSCFMRHYFEHAVKAGSVRAITGQTSIAHLPRAKLVRWVIPLPALAEQRRIAEILDTVDETMQATERVIAKLERTRSGVAARLFDGNESPVTRLREVASITSGSTPDRGRGDYWEGGIPWVKTGEVRGNVIERTEEHITRRALAECPVEVYPVGTVLVAMYGQGATRGRVAMLGVPATTNQACAAIEPTRGVLLARFLFEFLKCSYDELRSLAHGSHQENLSTRIVGSEALR